VWRSRPPKQRVWMGPGRYICGCERRITHTNAYSHRDGYSYRYSYCHFDGNGHSNSYSYANGYGDSHSQCDTDN